MIQKNTSQDCWEFWNCPEKIKKKCSASKQHLGRTCWKAAGYIASRNRQCTKLKEGHLAHCHQCPWFQQLNSDFDKITRRDTIKTQAIKTC
ncbi:MAG: hypothetical protein KAJ18_04000 [Candidatus Omnitrophica bacterium]|nr:hypothetical protein [Candidatus Omnitrophota bacterium]